MIEYLTPTQATARLTRATQGDPPLTPEDIAMLEGIARQTDDPYDDGTYDYDLNAGAAEGWMWRAGQLANQRRISAEGSTLENQQRWQQAVEMEGMYRSRSAAASRVTTGRIRRTDVI